MFLKRTSGTCKYFSSIKNMRSLRPTIRITKELFQLRLDVQNYNKDEIRVRAHPDFVIIEGKKEKDTEHGYVLRQFTRKFKLPNGCVPSKVKCTLRANDWLYIEAKRISKDDDTGPVEEVVVPIVYGRGDDQDPIGIGPPAMEPEIIVKDPCAYYPKIKPIDKK